MTTKHANEAYRADPVRLAAVRAQMQHRQEVYAEALEHLLKARDLMLGLGNLDDDAILGRVQKSVSVTAVAAQKDEWTITQPLTDTMVGNRAAFGSPLGWTPDLAALCAEGLSDESQETGR